MNKEWHFVKPKAATKEILTNKKVFFQDKYDGISIECCIDENTNSNLYGRGVLEGKDSDFTRKFPEITSELKKIDLPPMTNFLSETIIINPSTMKQDCGLASGRSKRNDNIQFYANKFPAQLIIHDVVMINGVYVGNLSYLNRLNSIKKHFLTPSNIISVIDVYNNGIEQWEKVTEQGLEGLIIRDPITELGNGGIWKLKQEITEDVYCKGEFQASLSKTYKNLEYQINGEIKKGVFANLVCYQLTSNGKEIPVCEVGGGFKIEKRIEIQQMLDTKQITKEKPLVIEVKANDRHESGKLRGPNFLRIRTDKPWKECIINETKSENKQKTIEDF